MQACGIVVSVALIAAGQLSPDPPSHGSPDDQVVAFYRQHTGGISTGAFLWDIAMMALILFSSALRRVCESPAPERPAVESRSSARSLVAAELLPLFSAVTAALFIVSQAIEAAAGVIAMHSSAISNIRALDEASHLTAHLGTLPLGCLILCAGLAQKATRASAVWIAWLGLVAGTTLIVTTSWIAIGQQRIHDAGVIGLVLFLLWSVSSSISLLRKKSLAQGEKYA
ncbi:MAG TPA: hypothetical protein VKV05_07810 [Terriglobales bacterium]|nr:hypothetical protein [Terriglobales bacterium]